MIPTIAAPNIQVPPPVDASVFTAPSQEPALGRLPLNIVPPPVTNPKVADDNRGGQQPARNTQNPAPRTVPNTAAKLFEANGEIAFESPYSTTFVAQLFGQFSGTEQGGISDGFLDFEQLAQFSMVKYRPSMAFRPPEEKPAQAQPEARPVMPAQEQAAPELPEISDIDLQAALALGIAAEPATPAETLAPAQPVAEPSPRPPEAEPMQTSIFVSGFDAYGATQSRNQYTLDTGTMSRRGNAAEVSMIL